MNYAKVNFLHFFIQGYFHIIEISYQHFFYVYLAFIFLVFIPILIEIQSLQDIVALFMISKSTKEVIDMYCVFPRS